MTDESLGQYFSTICFAFAVLHTFSVKVFQRLSHKYPKGSIGAKLCHFLGEVEVVFGLWAGFFILFLMAIVGLPKTIVYLENQSFTEPIFIFVIMVVCASRPILLFSEKIIAYSGRALPFNNKLGFYSAALVVGPLLGSFITEPAAMTVTALILLNNFYRQKISAQLQYATLGLLFVNVSIGGTLTPYAAPPVLMVASKWNWDLAFMFTNFGWKAIVAIILSTAVVVYRFRREISNLQTQQTRAEEKLHVPVGITLLHLFVLGAIVVSSHYPILFIGLFLLFLAIASVTKEYQTELKIRESALVGFFLGGLVVLGGQQGWWLEPILSQLSATSLYWGSMLLTAFADNAAITYLGSQVSGLSDISKYFLVAGSVVGGGLTVIANAPNPAGFSILNASFGPDGISSKRLLSNALVPTVIAAICFWWLK